MIWIRPNWQLMRWIRWRWRQDEKLHKYFIRRHAAMTSGCLPGTWNRLAAILAFYQKKTRQEKALNLNLQSFQHLVYISKQHCDVSVFTQYPGAFYGPRNKLDQQVYDDSTTRLSNATFFRSSIRDWRWTIRPAAESLFRGLWTRRQRDDGVISREWNKNTHEPNLGLTAKGRIESNGKVVKREKRTKCLGEGVAGKTRKPSENVTEDVAGERILDCCKDRNGLDVAQHVACVVAWM